MKIPISEKSTVQPRDRRDNFRVADDPPTAFVQLPFKQHAQSVREIQAILQEIEGIKAEIDKGSGFLGIFLDKEQLRIRKLLKIRLELSFQRLKELAEGKA